MRHRTLALGIWAVGALLAIFVVSRARYTADLSAFLPEHPTPQQQLLIEEIEQGPAARFIMIAISGAEPGTRAALSVALAARLEKNPLFRSVANGTSAPTIADQEFIFRYRYLLSDRINAGFFNTNTLRPAIHDNIDLLASSIGPLSRDLFARDPTGEALQVMSQIDRPNQPQLSDGIWVSADGQRALLIAVTVAPGSDTDGQEHAIAAIRDGFALLQSAAYGMQARAASLRLTGPAVFAVDARHVIEHEAVRLCALSSLLIAVLLLAVYRSLRILALGMLPVASGALVGVAAVALGFNVVQGVTLGFGITLIGESVDYSVYLFLQGQQQAGQPRDHAAWTATFWPTIRLGMLTSVVGFASLLPSNFPGLAQLGCYSIAGLVTAALVTRFVLPVILPATIGVRNIAPLGRSFLRLLGPLRRMRVLLWLVPIVAVAGIASHRSEIWNHELSALSPVSSEAQSFDARMRSDLGAADVGTLVVVTGISAETALEGAEQVAGKLQPLVASGVIAGYDSPTRYLPSLRTQKSRQDSLPPPAKMKAQFIAATQDLPIRPGPFSGFLDDIEAARHLPLATSHELAGTQLASGVEALLVPNRGHWHALVPLDSMHQGSPAYKIDTALIESTLQGLSLRDANVVVLDLKRESDALYSSYLSQSIRLSLGGLGAILVLLVVVLRSLGRVLRVMLPLVLAVLLVLMGFVVAGHAMTMLNLIGLLLVVAIGSNYCLFFDRESERQDDRLAERTFASLLVANATTVIGFGVLATSTVPVLSAIGMTVAPGAFLALVLGAILARHAPSERLRHG